MDKDDDKEEGGQFAGLSTAQKKKLKAKLKAEAEAKAKADAAGVTTAAPESVPVQKEEETPAESKEETKDDDKDEGGQFAGLSVAQKKKLKAKLKAEAEAAAKASGVIQADVEAESDAKDDPKNKGKKAKKGGANSAIAAKIRAQQEAKKAEQDEFDRLQREEEERIRKEEEEEKAKIEAEKAGKRAKKQQKLDKIAAMKASGDWLTPAEMEKKKIAELRKQQMIAAGLIPNTVSQAEGEEEVKTSSVMKRQRKNKKDKVKEEASEATQDAKKETQTEQEEHDSNDEEEVAEQKQKNKKVVVVEEEEDQAEFDDWENAIDDIAEKIVKKTKGTDVNQIDSDDGEETKSESTKTSSKIQPAGGAKSAAIQQPIKQESSAFDVSDDQDAILRRERQRQALAERKKQAAAAKKGGVADLKKKLRCPIICILGHVDTGKTLILDKLRKTNVQAGEAGGITQQIGATYFPGENLAKHLANVAHIEPLNLEIPGFLVIDTPGHESFTNLRSRGSSLCDMAVLVVDIMHGLEQQTLESIQLLRQKNTPFCIALNKIDRLNTWKPNAEMNTRDTLETQSQNAKNHFQSQLEKTQLAFNELGLNVALYWKNDSVEDTISFCPTSAITGEGLSDLMMYLCRMGQTSQRETLQEKDVFECTVLEVKVIEGHGTTIDVVLVNGLLKVGDTIVVSGMNGPIVTSIRALLTPQPMKELRVKGEYVHHQKIKGAMGIKISAPGLDSALAGSELFKCQTEHEIEEAKIQIEADLVDILEKYVDKTQDGVCVQASTIGSLEALLEFLKQMKIPVTSVNIGPIHKKDVLKACKAKATDKQKKEFATILAFDVRVMPDATKFAEEEGIKIFTANIIYHLFDEFTLYVQKCKEDRKLEDGAKAVFPCILEMVKDACFNSKSPIVIGVNVKEGVLRVGTPLCIPDRDNLRLGVVTSIELNKKPITAARTKDGSVAVKITNDGSVCYGRHFDDTCQIVSMITRDSIDLLKEGYRDDMTKDDWMTVMKLKKIFGIM